MLQTTNKFVSRSAPKMVLLFIPLMFLPNCIIHELSSYRLARAYELTVQNGGTFIERTMFNERKSQFFLGETDDPNQIESVIYTKIATTKSGENIFNFIKYLYFSGCIYSPNIESTVALDYCDYDCAGGHYGTVACKNLSSPIVKINKSAKSLGTRKIRRGLRCKRLP